MEGSTTIYAAKCYWPGVTEHELAGAGTRARLEAEVLTRQGSAVGFLGSLYFPGDDLVLCLFAASSRAAVKQANESAGIPCERIMESVWLARPGRELRADRCRGGNP
jgi:uncharacterized protein DUF4242